MSGSLVARIDGSRGTPRSDRRLLGATQLPPPHESRLEVFPGPECYQPPDHQPRDLQVVHAISRMTAQDGRGWAALYRARHPPASVKRHVPCFISAAEVLILGPGIIGGVLMGIIAWLLVGLIAG